MSVGSAGCVLRPSMPPPCWDQHQLSLLTWASALPGLHGQPGAEVIARFLIPPEWAGGIPEGYSQGLSCLLRSSGLQSCVGSYTSPEILLLSG